MHVSSPHVIRFLVGKLTLDGVGVPAPFHSVELMPSRGNRAWSSPLGHTRVGARQRSDRGEHGRDDEGVYPGNDTHRSHLMARGKGQTRGEPPSGGPLRVDLWVSWVK